MSRPYAAPSRAPTPPDCVRDREQRPPGRQVGYNRLCKLLGRPRVERYQIRKSQTHKAAPMRILQPQHRRPLFVPSGRHRYSRLQPSSIEPTWLNKSLQQLAALPLKESTYNAIARAAREYPGFFVDDDERSDAGDLVPAGAV